LKDQTNYKLVAAVGLGGSLVFAFIGFVKGQALTDFEISALLFNVAMLGLVGMIADKVGLNEE